MKEKHPLLAKVTAVFLIAFILGGYFGLLSAYLGQNPMVVVQYLYMLGVFGSFICAVIWFVLYVIERFFSGSKLR